MNKLLIIFAKNPELGKVKTRLANAIGDDAALAIYYKLVNRTQQVTQDLEVDKAVYYTNFIDHEDSWDDRAFQKYLQHGDDLGVRMYNAIKEQLAKGYDQVLLIGTDIYDLTTNVIQDSFNKLDETDVVIGPAEDGGYYLIGMTKPHSPIFQLNEWSTDHVFDDTIEQVKRLGLTYLTTKTLNDIDDINDLRRTDLV